MVTIPTTFHNIWDTIPTTLIDIRGIYHHLPKCNILLITIPNRYFSHHLSGRPLRQIPLGPSALFHIDWMISACITFERLVQRCSFSLRQLGSRYKRPMLWIGWQNHGYPGNSDTLHQFHHSYRLATSCGFTKHTKHAISVKSPYISFK